MIATQDQLQAVFRDNFMAYYRAHVAHVNIQGRNFYSDHKLLGKIYQHLQDNIDHIAELIRTVGEFMPTDLQTVLVDAMIGDDPVTGTAQDMLEMVRTDLLALIDQYRQLDETAAEDELAEITDFAQAEIRALNQFVYFLDSTLTPEQ